MEGKESFKMKKRLVSVVLSGVLLVSLAACGSSTEQTGTASSPAESLSEQQDVLQSSGSTEEQSNSSQETTSDGSILIAYFWWTGRFWETINILPS